MRKNILSNYLFVIKQITYKESKRYTNETQLGVVWNVLNPFLYMIILSAYYENIVIHDIPIFPVFAFVGVIVFTYYRSGTMGAMKSIVNNKNLLIKSKVPIVVFIFQKVLYAFKEFLYGCIALVPVLIFFKVRVTIRAIELVPLLMITTVIVTGIGVILAVAYVFFADIEYLYYVFMSLMIFISGVFIPLEHLPEGLQRIMEYNPIFLSIYIFRNALVYNLPSHWTAWAKLAIWAIGILIISYNLYEAQRDKCINML